MKRFRIFAGPNGSGKSTIIKHIRQVEINSHPIDFGVYVNADDIAANLNSHTFDFSTYELDSITLNQLTEFASASGLFRNGFNEARLRNSITVNANRVRLAREIRTDMVAQLLSNFLIN